MTLLTQRLAVGALDVGFSDMIPGITNLGNDYF